MIEFIKNVFQVDLESRIAEVYSYQIELMLKLNEKKTNFEKNKILNDSTKSCSNFCKISKKLNPKIHFNDILKNLSENLKFKSYSQITTAEEKFLIIR
ncbi:hypothetical protein BpHYR1_030451 [Brachionus plicatilis]|uniref:Uncharacterized protein n=1 Tax=Brachionus plicatilis TaxID=10195 RepID=A0A3M7QTU9_BRAPC|nr:hypothetical protein BpHYR1_030451 [Brachionus plicatilis]